MQSSHFGTIILALAVGIVSANAHAASPSIDEVIASRLDLWGEAALQRPEGPTYDYFAALVPPIRYVDAGFHHYPIVLSAPGAATKGRVLSNGSQINALARQPNWLNEMGMPVHVLLGPRLEQFGADLRELNGPKYAEGYLPIVQLGYNVDGARYTEEVFASVAADSALSGTVIGRFTIPAADGARLQLQFEDGYDGMTAADGMVRDAKGRLVANFDENWEWNFFRSTLTTKARHAGDAHVAIFTVPLDSATTPPRMSQQIYERERTACTRAWNEILSRGMQVDVPERYVNNAWKSLIVAMFGISIGDNLNYSAGNQYARMYASETSDAMRGLLYWGFHDDIRRMMPPLLRKRRANMEFHYAGFELQFLADYFFRTHDRVLVEETRAIWEPLIKLITTGRELASGMLPREKYCTDIDTMVYNLKSNTACWRGLRDISLLLEDLGETSRAREIATIAAEYRQVILRAIDTATTHAIDPPFTPIALGGEEEIHEPITATRIGSYWNLVIGYTFATGVFPYDSPITSNMLRYQQTHGGICMGMIRVLSEPTWWVNSRNIDDLYGIRYALMLQQRDDADRALVSFYGKLAQGMTRDTFIDGESTSIMPYDEFGRQVYLPPNSTANSSFLQQLRCLLVQDWDMDADGRADTLRLLFATPRAWLEDGKTIRVQNAPTAFGPVSINAHSELANGKVTVDLDLPTSTPAETLLKLRLPRGYRIRSARTAVLDLRITSETMSIAGLHGHQTITVMLDNVRQK